MTNKDETTQEESTDQPVEPSTPDQAQEESQDQPTAEVEEETAETTPSEEAQDDSDEEGSETILIDGEEYTPEEAKEFLSKGKHFTYNMQKLREREKELEQVKQSATPKEPTPEEKEIEEARKTLKKYGVVTEDEVDAKLRQLELNRARRSQFSQFRQRHPEVTDFAARMIDGAARAWNISYEEAYKKGWGDSKTPKKVVRKKTLGARKSASTPVSGKGGGVITRADIEKMSAEEYKKKLPQIEKLIREGELK